MRIAASSPRSSPERTARAAGTRATKPGACQARSYWLPDSQRRATTGRVGRHSQAGRGGAGQAAPAARSAEPIGSAGGGSPPRALPIMAADIKLG